MFQVNDYVVYGKYSVCKVVDICTPPFDGVDKTIKYYMLKPMSEKGSTIYTPVENNKVSMRNIMTKEEAMELIDKFPEMEMISVENEKSRELCYRNSLLKGDCEELFKMIKTLFIRREERLASGKKMSTTDEKYLRQAEDSLFEELSFAFGWSKEKVKDYFIQKIKKLGDFSYL